MMPRLLSAKLNTKIGLVEGGNRFVTKVPCPSDHIGIYGNNLVKICWCLCWGINLVIFLWCKGNELLFDVDLGAPFFPGGPEIWHHPLAYSAAAAELPGAALQHATLVHPALHPQVPPPMSLPHPTALTSVHAASLPHFLPSPALASPVGSSSSQPGLGMSNPPCSTLFVANLGQFVSEHELKEIFGR
nr:uncharacterized protein LOC111421601 [Onthophagus taurus]